MKEVKRTSGTFTDGSGHKHHLSKDAILIDLTTGKVLTDLLEEAYKLDQRSIK